MGNLGMTEILLIGGALLIFFGPAKLPQLGKSLGQLWALIVSLRQRQSLGAHLISSMLYRDALNALYAMGGIYAVNILGWTITQLGVFGIIGALSAALFTWIGGKVDSARGPKPVILV